VSTSLFRFLKVCGMYSNSTLLSWSHLRKQFIELVNFFGN